MPPILATVTEAGSRRTRYDRLAGQPRRGNVAASAVVVAVLAQLLLAQLTLVLVVCLAVAGLLGRWRPSWLILPAAAGLVLMLDSGTRSALAGYAAIGAELARRLTGPGPILVRLAGLRQALVAWRMWLPGQLPVALIAGAGEAALVQLAGRRRAAGGRYRPGAIVAIRRAYLTAALRRGEVATADGGCVGVQQGTGRAAAISWPEAQDGVLCAGQEGRAVTDTAAELARAAIAHRKTVIIIDLTAGEGGDVTASEGGDAGLAGRVRAGLRAARSLGAPERLAALIEQACGAVGAPLHRLDEAHGHYEPFALADPDRAADLVSALVDWTGIAPPRQALCADYLRVALAVIAATDGARGPVPVPVLDDLIRLLGPGELRARSRQMPGGGPAADVLARRAADLARQLDGDPAVAAPVAAQLAGLRSTALGGRLRRDRAAALAQQRRTVAVPDHDSNGPPLRAWRAAGPVAARPPGEESPISLENALVRREVVLFSLDRRSHGQPAALIAGLVIADVTGVLAERSLMGVRCDGLIWINGCEAVGQRQLADLVELGSRTGIAVLLSTTSDAVAARLAGLVNVLAVRGPAPPALAAAAGAEPAGPQLSDEVTVHVRHPRPRLVTGCRAIR